MPPFTVFGFMRSLKRVTHMYDKEAVISDNLLMVNTIVLNNNCYVFYRLFFKCYLTAVTFKQNFVFQCTEIEIVTM